MQPHLLYTFAAGTCLAIGTAYAGDAPPSPISINLEQMQKCLKGESNKAQLACYIRLTKNLAFASAAAGKDEHLAQREQLQTLREQMLNHQEPSYVTASSGLRLKSDTSTSNLLYEAQLVKSISIYDGAESHSANPSTEAAPHGLWFDAPVRIAVRQLTTASLPIRTPSFNPGLRLTWAPQAPFAPRLYYSLGLHHYSNGQEGNGTVSATNGKLNLKSGTFNTNYVEIAASNLFASDAKIVEWAQIGFRQHLYGTFEEYQNNQYPRHQLTLALHSKEFNIKGVIPWDLQVRLTQTIGAGYRYVVKDDVTPARNVDAKLRDRINSRIEIFTKPGIIDNLRLYLRYDYGYDYYNINFQQRINRFQIGLAAFSD